MTWLVVTLLVAVLAVIAFEVRRYYRDKRLREAFEDVLTRAAESAQKRTWQ